MAILRTVGTILVMLMLASCAGEPYADNQNVRNGNANGNGNSNGNGNAADCPACAGGEQQHQASGLKETETTTGNLEEEEAEEEPALGTVLELGTDPVLALLPAENGFSLGYRSGVSSYNHLQQVQDPLATRIDGELYVIHVIRTNTEPHYKKEIAVVQPDTLQLHSYTLFDVELEDIYNADSISVVFGFRDNRHIVYVAPNENYAAGEGYRIEQMDVTNGETSVLFPTIPNAEAEDHFYYSSGDISSGKLLINSYRSGQLWSFDLEQGTVNYTDSGFSHPWPFYAVTFSPDNERLWYWDWRTEPYRYRLFLPAGERIAEFTAGGDSFFPYPAFQWSPDSRYAVFQDTLEYNADYIIAVDPEREIFAAERIRFYDRDGQLVRTAVPENGKQPHIELAGWLEPDNAFALLHEFGLGPETEGIREKIGSRYRLLNLDSGESIWLEQNDPWRSLAGTQPVASAQQSVFSPGQQIFNIDMDRQQLIVLTSAGKRIYDPASGLQGWIAYGSNSGDKFGNNSVTDTIHWVDPQSGEPSTYQLPSLSYGNIIAAGSDWVVSEQTHYYSIGEKQTAE